MQMAGAGDAFPYASGHATWIVKAIRNKKAGRLTAPLVGYPLGAIPLAVGDLIGKPRQQGVTYANAVATGWFTSHSDIVVDIDVANGIAHVIGGNVANSVSMTEVKVDRNGKLKASGGWIVHIQNNIAAPAAVPAPVPSALHVG
jgi:hypothetical protein